MRIKRWGTGRVLYSRAWQKMQITFSGEDKSTTVYPGENILALKWVVVFGLREDLEKQPTLENVSITMKTSVEKCLITGTKQRFPNPNAMAYQMYFRPRGEVLLSITVGLVVLIVMHEMQSVIRSQLLQTNK